MSDKSVRSDIYSAITKSKKRIGPGAITDGDVRRTIPMGGQRDTLEYTAPRARFQTAPVFKPLQGSVTTGMGAGYTMRGKRGK